MRHLFQQASANPGVAWVVRMVYSVFAYGHPMALPAVGGCHDETLVLPKLVVSAMYN
jgi:hypothetical protein